MRGNQPLFDFFNKYPGFGYNPSNSSIKEWKRLCRYCGWPTKQERRHHAEREQAYEEFRRAMTLSFNQTFGESDEDGTAWDRLCSSAGISDIPESLQEKKRVSFCFTLTYIILIQSDHAFHACKSL
jgi:hypothetical protein